MQEVLERLKAAILGFREPVALEATRELLDAGTEPETILEEGLTRAMLELGERWNRGLVFLPQVMVAARIFTRCSKLVEPCLLDKSEATSGQAVVLATVKGDMHDLGKSIVGAMIKTTGLAVHDLGKDVPASRIVEAVERLDPCLVGLSAMLTTTMPQQERVIEELERAGLRSKLKIVVGGAPVTARWADRIGADAYAANAAEAVGLARAARA